MLKRSNIFIKYLSAFVQGMYLDSEKRGAHFILIITIKKKKNTTKNGDAR